MLFFLSLALVAAPATEDSTAPSQEMDGRCLALVAYAVGKATDEKAKMSLMGGMFYFVGKVKGRDPNYDLEKEMRRSYATLGSKPDIANAEQTRCSAELVKLGMEMSVAGKALQTNP